ncbi:glucan endo-1,3-beta-glucosidase, acidic-like [Rhododendron vialii]|uniref:glucan endo-1,3-beta-glucosidase, acidic-like n=1 Tax=Rhododendron vialii TaxID=182163 RepID=UPI00265D8D0C|nr:glucan endo-1,3-beta-glucosidase, acidic-like [Rhododendron vialii]
MLDNAYSAVEKAGGPNVEIVVSDSGWPSAGGPDASVENAATYYRNLINHVEGGSGSPKRPRKAIETYLFAMFVKNQKTGVESEKHLGSSHPPNSPNTSFLSTKDIVVSFMH